jgi:organic radical activating enzyme
MPWAALYIDRSNYDCCCLFPLKQDQYPYPSSKNELFQIFNSSGFQDIRKRIINMDIEGTPCVDCHIRKENELSFYASSYRSHVEKGNQENAWKNIHLSAAKGETIVNHLPVIIHHCTCADCNFRCVMCYNSNLPDDYFKNAFVPYQKFFTLLADIGLENIDRVVLTGGEPFLNHDSLKIIQHLADRQETGVLLHVITNGSLVHRHKKILSKFENLNLSFSIEGYESTYEYIRKGSSWSRLLNNLDWCIKESKKNKGWRINVSSVVMKSSLPDLNKVLELAKNRNIDIGFGPIVGDYFEENIFEFPELLNNTDWENNFDAAIVTAADTYPEAANSLERMKTQIQSIIGTNTSSKIFTGTPDKFKFLLRFVENTCEHNNILFVGTKHYFVDFLTWCHDRTAKKFHVADFNITDTSRMYAGWPVVDMQKIPKQIDAAFISCSTFEYKKYSNFIKEKYPDLKLYTLPYWDERMYNNLKILKQEINSKPVVLYAAGGSADILLQTTNLNNFNIVAFSDGNPKKHGTFFHKKIVVPPHDIVKYAYDVIICSENYFSSIFENLKQIHGDAISIHRIF